MTILEIFAKQAVELAAKAIESKFLKNEAKLSESDITPRNLQLHLKYVANWSAGIQLYGLGKAKDTDSETIELLYHETARKFRAKNSGNDKKTEQSILYDAAHIILVGDPGAGKTTTLKRVARSIFKESIEGHAQTYQLPILIRLKELERYSDIYQYLGELMGFPVGIKEKVIVEEIKKQDYDDDGKKIVRVERKETKIPYPAIGGTEVTQFIINFLDNSGALLLIDGLDEIKKNLFSAFVSDIRKLALELSFAKIIITSRTGVYYTLGTIEGFNVLDILPLDTNQIYALAAIWTKHPSEFVSALRNSPYNDLADRPLLLSQLLFIFDRYGTLPRYPREVYQLVLDLLLKEWDADRQIVRSSKYSDFTSKRKSEFLAELAFQLMYIKNAMQFGTKELVEIYSRICGKFELPENEATSVAGEIESHTGILISVGHASYEFSHLSIQEYLCAEYIVRSPLNHNTVDLIRKYPEPVAIAVALASDSTSWLFNLITDTDAFDALKPSIGAFVSRLVVERPVFTADDLLGCCVFCVYVEFMQNNAKAIPTIFSKFIHLPGIRESIQQFIKNPTQASVTDMGRGKPYRQVKITFNLPNHHMSHSSYTRSFLVDKNIFDEFKVSFGT